MKISMYCIDLENLIHISSNDFLKRRVFLVTSNFSGVLKVNKPKIYTATTSYSDCKAQNDKAKERK